MKNRKAQCENGVTSEVIKDLGLEIKERLREMINEILVEKEIPKDWDKGIIVPLYK